MPSIPESIKQQIANPKPDIDQFLAVIAGRTQPSRVHLAELFADQEIMQWITENVLGRKWTPIPTDGDRSQAQQHLLCEIEYWYRMGYDYIRVGGGIGFPADILAADNSAELAQSQRAWANLSSGPIQNQKDYDSYPWPTVTPDDLWMYEFVAKNLPDGMGILVCPQSGFLEIPLDMLIGYESMALMMYDDPDLIKAVFERCRDIVMAAYRQIIDVPNVVGCFQGDDMGFRTGTLMPPEFLKTHSLPGHKQLADLVHSKGKVHFLHSCGNLSDIMDYLIDDIGIDAKHSFEDAIMPVEQAYDTYGNRVALLGGLDVHLLASADEQTVRQRTRDILNHCIPNGRFAFGSGNTIANYSKPQNVLAMFDEAFRWA